MQFATIYELGGFLLGSAEIPEDFGWGVRGSAQLLTRSRPRDQR